ncbi:hypothetical protein UlMin_016850 [Ulmus minor]
MGLTLKNTLAIALFFILGMLASQATSRTFHEDALSEKHKQWMAEHSRSYADSAEREKRFKIFKDNVDFIEKFNSEGNHTYKLGINRFSDLTDEEFLRYYTGSKKPITSNPSPYKSFKYENVTNIPDSLDWREQGAVTKIKDQGQCGCCWAFSAVAAVEGITKITRGNLVSLSEQQLLDCVTTGSSSVCEEGGMKNDAFRYIIQNGGITTEEQYQYMAAQGTCQTEREQNAAAQISGYEDVPKNDEEALLKAVIGQPVGASVDATSLKSYQGGILPGDCGNSLNHAVTVIGYGTSEQGIKYWLIKNSWGERWGENGYAKIERDSGTQGGACGIAMRASYPIV